MRPVLLVAGAAAMMSLVAAPVAAQQTQSSLTVTRMSDGDAMLRAFRDRVLLDTLALWEDVPLSGPRTYARVKDILAALKIPVAQTDSVHGILWNEGFVTRGNKVGGKANSQLLRCGSGPSGDHADQWRVTMAYAVFVKSSPGDLASKLGIAVVAQAKDIAGANSPAVVCNTKGVLETEIVKLVRGTTQP